MQLPRWVAIQRRMPGGKPRARLVRRWMPRRQVQWETVPRRRSRRFGSSGIRRHHPPPARTAFQFVNHLHHGVRVAACHDRYLRHRSVASVPNAIRPDLEPVESQIRAPRQVGLDRGLDLSSGIHLAGVASERENQRRESSGKPPHRPLHGITLQLANDFPGQMGQFGRDQPLPSQADRVRRTRH